MLALVLDQFSRIKRRSCSSLLGCCFFLSLDFVLFVLLGRVERSVDERRR